MGELIGDNKRIAKNTIYLYIRMGISMIVSLYTARIVLSTLGEVDYGIFNVVTGVVAMFTFLNGALSGSASRFLTYELGTGNHISLSKTFSATLVVHLLLAIIIVILCETIGLWFLEHKLIIPTDKMYSARWAYQISILIIVVSLIQVPYGALIIAHEKMNVYAYLSFFDIGARLAMIFLLQTLKGDKLIIWSWMIFAVSMCYTLIYIMYDNKHFKEAHLKFHHETKLYKSLVSYAWWDLIGNISGMLQGQGINMLLNMFFGPVVNAARGISYQVQGIINQFTSNFTLASKPQIIKLYANNQISEMMRLVEISGCIAFYLTWFFTLPIALEIKYILKLWLGSYPDYTVSFTQITMIMGLVMSVKSSRVSAIHATGKIKITNIIVGLVLCSAFPLAYGSLKLGFNPNSALILSVITTFIAEMVAVFVLRRYIKFSIRQYFGCVYMRCAVVAIISAIIPVIIYINMPEGFVRLLAIGLTTSICSTLTILYIGVNAHIRRKILKKFCITVKVRLNRN